jgi:ABC-type multidrug transport system ATPase subunit
MIKINNLSYGFKTTGVLAKNVNLTICDNDRLAIIGENGSGKTTFLHIIAKHLPISNGEIIYPTDDYRIIFIPANLDKFLFPWYKVGQNISFYKTNGISLNKIDASINKLIEKYLENKNKNFHENYIYTLSSGEKAVIAFICALYSKPNLIILDEIFSNTSRIVSYKIIQTIKDELKIPVIFTSHTKEYIEELSNKKFSLMDYK